MTTDNLIIPSAGMSTPIDRDKLKIASFRTKEGVWADFTAAANKLGLTATDVIKAAMEQFIAGEYLPSINTGTYTAVNTQSGITRDEIQQLIDTAVSTAINTESIEASVMTIVNTLSLRTDEDVSTAINTALVPLRDEITEVAEFSRNLQGEIAKVKRAIGDPSGQRSSRVENSTPAATATAPKPTRKTAEALDLKTATDVNWSAFHQAVGLEAANSKKSVELGAIAIDKATQMGFSGWIYNSKKQRFYRNSP